MDPITRASRMEQAVERGPFALMDERSIDALGPLERAAAHVEPATALLGAPWDGVLVALVPGAVLAEDATRAAVRSERMALVLYKTELSQARETQMGAIQ